MATESSEFGTGKTILVLAIVVGCFAVLWPKIFYPMLTGPVSHDPSPPYRGKPICIPCEIKFEKEKNNAFLYELCNLVAGYKHRSPALLFKLCKEKLAHSCGIELDEDLVERFRKNNDTDYNDRLTNFSACLKNEYNIERYSIVQVLQTRNVTDKHVFPNKRIPQERSNELRPDMMHPALREKGQNIPPGIRTIEKDARPGPMPGMRPTIGGPGHVLQGNKQTSTMSIIMPVYTIAIVIFFIYTILKILLKKPAYDATPKVQDFHLDPEHRKFVCPEEYTEADPYSIRDYMRKQQEKEKAALAKEQLEKENVKIGRKECDAIIDAIEGIVKEIDEYKAMKTKMGRTAANLEEIVDEAAVESVTQTQQTETETQEVPECHLDDSPVCEVVKQDDIETTEEIEIHSKSTDTAAAPCQLATEAEVTLPEVECTVITAPLETAPENEAVPSQEEAEIVIEDKADLIEITSADAKLSSEGETPDEAIMLTKATENLEASPELEIHKEADDKDIVSGDVTVEDAVVTDVPVSEVVYPKVDETSKDFEEAELFDVKPAEVEVSSEIKENVQEDGDTVELIEHPETVTDSVGLSEKEKFQLSENEVERDRNEIAETKPDVGKVEVDGEETKKEVLMEERAEELAPTPDPSFKEVEVIIMGMQSTPVGELETESPEHDIVGEALDVPEDLAVTSYILDGSVGSDVQLLVSEAQCEALSLNECHLNNSTEFDDISDPVVISGKMTLSFIEGNTLSCASEVADLSLDGKLGDEEPSVYDELPEDNPQQDVLADIEKQIEELENAMKEVQAAVGVVKPEEPHAKQEIAPTMKEHAPTKQELAPTKKSDKVSQVSEAETEAKDEEDVSEYKSLRADDATDHSIPSEVLKEKASEFLSVADGAKTVTVDDKDDISTTIKPENKEPNKDEGRAVRVEEVAGTDVEIPNVKAAKQDVGFRKVEEGSCNIPEEEAIVFYEDTLTDEARDYVRKIAQETVQKAINDAIKVLAEEVAEADVLFSKESDDTQTQLAKENIKSIPTKSASFEDSEVVDELCKESKLEGTKKWLSFGDTPETVDKELVCKKPKTLSFGAEPTVIESEPLPQAEMPESSSSGKDIDQTKTKLLFEGREQEIPKSDKTRLARKHLSFGDIPDFEESAEKEIKVKMKKRLSFDDTPPAIIGESDIRFKKSFLFKEDQAAMEKLAEDAELENLEPCEEGEEEEKEEIEDLEDDFIEHENSPSHEDGILDLAKQTVNKVIKDATTILKWDMGDAEEEMIDNVISELETQEHTPHQIYVDEMDIIKKHGCDPSDLSHCTNLKENTKKLLHMLEPEAPTEEANVMADEETCDAPQSPEKPPVPSEEKVGVTLSAAQEEAIIKKALEEAMEEPHLEEHRAIVHEGCGEVAETCSPVEHAAVVHDASGQSAVLLQQVYVDDVVTNATSSFHPVHQFYIAEVVDVKHKSYGAGGEDKPSPSGSSSQSSFEMVGGANNSDSTSSFEQISRNGSPPQQQQQEET